LLSIVGAVAYNLWKWRHDRTLADHLRTELVRPRPALPATPRVSILVAAWNESRFIERHINSVLGLSYPNTEYVLCAGGTDGTFEIARAYASSSVIVLQQLPGEGKQRALQRAFEQSTGEIVFLTDADCLLDDENFERTIQPIVYGKEFATSGDSMPLPEQLTGALFSRYQWAVQEYAAAHAGAYLDSLLGRNAAVHRAVLGDVAEFRGDVPTGTDYHLGKRLRRAGYAIRHVPHSLVRTDYPSDLRVYIRQQRRWLRNVVLLGAQSGSWHEVRQAVLTSAVGATMLLTPVMIPVLGQAVLAMWWLAFLHSAAAKVRYVAFASRITGQSDATSALLAPAFTLLEFCVWALPLVDYPFTTRRRQW
jgi:cellulose synthase/poly-beta-1,6-N-acetylglucosamine synthase-like glycosyltransferase